MCARTKVTIIKKQTFPATSTILADIINKKLPLKCSWCPKRPSDPVPESKVLSIVVVVEQMVICMVCRAIDQWLEDTRNTIITVVNGYSPQVDKDKQDEVEDFV